MGLALADLFRRCNQARECGRRVVRCDPTTATEQILTILEWHSGRANTHQCSVAEGRLIDYQSARRRPDSFGAVRRRERHAIDHVRFSANASSLTVACAAAEGGAIGSHAHAR